MVHRVLGWLLGWWAVYATYKCLIVLGFVHENSKMQNGRAINQKTYFDLGLA